MNKKLKVISIFGTRSEAIKMAPLVKTMEKDDRFESKVLVTAQHRQMLDQVLEIFDIKPDFDLNIMKQNQTLAGITSSALTGIDEVLREENPDIVLVHGDTTTTLAASLAAFYNNVKVGHVEAGLRSGDKLSPFPEEMNRSIAGRIADLHFSPTEGNRQNLLSEGIKEDDIFITGNTVIDALLMVTGNDYEFETPELKAVDFDNKKVVLLTAHRRENHGKPMENIFKAVKRLIEEFDDIEVVFPVHLNPKVRAASDKILKGVERVHLIEPLEYEPFANLIAKSYLVLTDSGGIQEEAPALGKPVLVLRRETERPEAIKAGTVKLAGVEENDIYELAKELLVNQQEYDRMSKAVNPYGIGDTSQKICQILLDRLQ